MKVPSNGHVNAHPFGNLLFDIGKDPGQAHPIADKEIETRMTGLMTKLMKQHDAPEEQYERLGLNP